ncbi:MAG: chromosome segregation protein SMC [Acidobacteria bacterium RIFCSPLOWO2_12_FULL_59_11]|nr:MAG: chromosome segregation protein SMC [Acidobacteria bacterium RIFCSPLOWO2_12_FULL_59_11]
MLRLQKLELLGFKSFADRTEINLAGTGVVGVVGPNGCGKSNISDAISWALGEQSPRSLRSSRMQDVIFSGTPLRKATGMAEVTITLVDPDREAAFLAGFVETVPVNGENGTLSRAERLDDSTETITISRRLFQSGESEYLLDGRPCRLRDIQEIFLGTGLGPDCYAILEQGRIGQILSAKPYERRTLIEEAAGVTKFKAKRKLAWAKLESSKQNLARVNDILEEIRRQLNSLQRQASRARRYAELREQVQTQLRLVLANRYRQQKEEAVRVALKLGFLNHSLQEFLARIANQENERQALHSLLGKDESELRRAVEERSTLRLAAERARSQVASQSQQIAHLKIRIEEGHQETERLRSRHQEFESERNRCSESLGAIQSDMDNLSTQLRECEGRFRGSQEEIKTKETRWELLRQETLETVHQCATLRSQIVQMEQYLSSTERQIEQISSQRQAAKAARQATLAKRQQVYEFLVHQQEELQSLAVRRCALEEDLGKGREEQSRLQLLLAELRSQVSAQHARQSSLQEVLARRAYSTETIQRLFELQTVKNSGSGNHGQSPAEGSADSAENLHRRFEPVGVLADFVEVDPAYEHVVEEFLKEELDFIVVRDWEAASEGVRLLKSKVPGRATFLLHSGMASPANGGGNGHAHIPGEPLPGTLESLESRLRFTNGFSTTAGALLPRLQRCYFVPNTQKGRALASEHPDCYFLTPEGEWFHGSTVTAGRADSRGPLGLKRELRELTRTLASQEELAAQTAGNLTRATESIAQQEAALRTLGLEQQETEKRLLGAERDLKEAHDEMERASERLSLLTLDVERLRREAERARERRAQDTEVIASREQRQAAVEVEITLLRQTLAQLGAEREAVRERMTQIQSQLAALEERHRTGVETLARVERNREELSRRLAELDRQCTEWNQQKDHYLEENQRLEQEAVAAEQRAELLVQQAAEIELACELHRKKLGELEQALQQQRLELEEMRTRKTAVEVQFARLESELNHLKEACQGELQMELETLETENLPPLSAEEMAAAEETSKQLKAKLEGLGPINMMALEEFEECRQRHDFLENQRQDLLNSIRDTTQAIEEIDTITNQQFQEAFEQINTHFQETFRQLFGGGQAGLRLTEAEDPAEAGIEILAQPPGKRLQNVLLLSGGEKALAAMALLLAIFRYKPSPFCILDEVDAPLDDANIGRFTKMIEEMGRQTQFILITHSKKTMNIAPVLYGVTMEEPGVSKIVSVKFNGAADPAPQRQLAEAVA